MKFEFIVYEHFVPILLILIHFVFLCIDYLHLKVIFSNIHIIIMPFKNCLVGTIVSTQNFYYLNENHVFLKLFNFKLFKLFSRFLLLSRL